MVSNSRLSVTEDQLSTSQPLVLSTLYVISCIPLHSITEIRGRTLRPREKQLPQVQILSLVNYKWQLWSESDA
jgi:hypothetical protein